MASDKALRPVRDVVCALFAKYTEGAIDRSSDSEEDNVLEGENDRSFDSSAGDTGAASNGEDINDCEEDIIDEMEQPAKRIRSSSTGRQSRRTKIAKPGPTVGAMEATSPLESWSLLFSREMLDEVVSHTNEELGRRRLESEVVPSYYNDLTREELKAFLGLLYFSGVQKTRDTTLEEMWSVKLGWTLYRATMPSKRFEFLSTNLRFDDKLTRGQRRETDKFAPIRAVWQMFLANCREYYTPHEVCTVDELFISFRGRCPFKVQHRSGKPEKHGIKIITLNDSQTFYTYDASPFVGKSHGNGLKPLPEHCVPKLSDSTSTSSRKKICQEYSTARKTGRWPVRVWMAILDIGAVNAMILHNFNTSNERMNRPKFLKTLAISLVDEHLRQRIAVPSLRRDLRFLIEKILNVDIPTDYRKTNLLEKKTRCNLCPRGKDRKTRHACYCCRRAICDEHRASVCADCCTRD